MAADSETSHGSARDEERGRDTCEAVESAAERARQSTRSGRDAAHEALVADSGCVELARDSHRPIFATDALIDQ